MKNIRSNISRRNFLKASAVVGGAGLLAACSQAATPSLEPTTVPAATDVPSATDAPATAVPATEVPATEAPAEFSLPRDQFPIDCPDHQPDGWTTNLIPPPIKYDPPVEFTQNFDLSPEVRFKEGDSIDNNIMTRFLEYTMGIKPTAKWQVVRGEAQQTKWSTAMAGGDLPDYMTWLTSVPGQPGGDLTLLMDADALEDITDIWERVASPTVKEWKGWKDGKPVHPWWGPCVKGGRIYAIPNHGGNTLGDDSLLWIRQDWLDKVGMGLPTTIAELEAVALAFMEKCGAKMGISATIGLSYFLGGGWMASQDYIFGAYGSMPELWLKGEDGKLVNGSTLPGAKDALAVLRRWHELGILSPEFVALNAPELVADNVANGEVGIMNGPAWCIAWPCKDATNLNPEASWSFFTSPAGPSGKVGRGASPLSGMMSGFRKGVDARVVEANIQWLNWKIERQLHRDENHDYFGFVGYTWIFDEQGNLVQGPDITSDYEPGLGGYPGWSHLATESVLRKNSAEHIAKIDPAKLNAFEKRSVSNPDSIIENAALAELAKTIHQQYINQFTGLPGPAMQENGARLTSKVLETYLNIITGKEELDAFDALVESWYADGGQAMTDEVNAWYATL